MKRSFLVLVLACLLALPACSAESRVSSVRDRAEKGDLRAEALLGEMYANGTDVTQSYPEAAKWWTKSAGGGYARAQYNLGVMYEHGQGVPKSDAQAAAWYSRAASQGLPEAQFNMGVMYEQGRGVQQSRAEAASWYRKAAEQGNPDAQFNLGSMYARDRQMADAYFWLSLVAKTGDHEAQQMRDSVGAVLGADKAADVRSRVNSWRPVAGPG